MADFVILSDSACDLTRDLRKRFGVEDYLRGALYYPDGSERTSDLDWETITPEEFFGIMKEKKAFFKTASGSLGDAKTLFERYLAQGKDVLMITISSAISATYDVCLQAYEEIKGKYPRNKVVVVDSLRYSTSLAIQLVKASELRAAGKSIDEVAAWITENRNCVHQMGMLDDLFYCKKMGRVSGIAAVMGTLVGVRPMADFSRKGMSSVIGKAKGDRSAEIATVEYVRRTIRDPGNQILFIAHSLREKQAESFRKRIESELHPKEIIVTTVGQACGPGIGPGLVAVFYYGEPISEDLSKETCTLAQILAKKE